MNKLLVIVPYRNREQHLPYFISYITSVLNEQKIKNKIIIVEQNQGDLFNRGLLCNIGFSVFNNESNYLCIHDIDMIGENFDYSYEPIVTHLSAKSKKKNYIEWYSRYLGGVVLFPNDIFKQINGFSNEYWGWGKEDDDLRLRCDVMECKVQRKQCIYYTLEHETIPYHLRLENSPGYKENLDKFNTFARSKNKKQLILCDGLSTINNFYTISSIIEEAGYTLVKTIAKRL